VFVVECRGNPEKSSGWHFGTSDLGPTRAGKGLRPIAEGLAWYILLQSSAYQRLSTKQVRLELLPWRCRTEDGKIEFPISFGA
jgi:hypothetical protein